MTWALLAQSAINGECSGILAASEDICDYIEANEDGIAIGNLFIWPDYFSDPGFYLWQGTMEQALEGENDQTTRVAPANLQCWIDHSGEPG